MKALLIFLVLLLMIPFATAQGLNITINATEATQLINTTDITDSDNSFFVQLDVTDGLKDGVINTTFIVDNDQPTFNLSAIYRMEENGGIFANDTSGNQLDGTLFNSPVFVASKFANNTGAFSLRLDGSNDYVRIDDDSLLDFGNEDFSVTFWMNSSLTGTRQGLLNKRVLGAGGGFPGFFVFIFEGTDVVRVGFEGTSGGTASLDSSTVVTDGEWKHIAVTVDRSDVMKIYVNGFEEDDLAIGTFNGPLDNALDLILGAHNLAGPSIGDHFEGNLDEVTLWHNKSLSLAEVQAIYENGVNLERTAIKLNFSRTINSSNNFFLHVEQTSALNATYFVHHYLNETAINQTFVTGDFLSPSFDIPLNDIIIDGSQAVFRFFTSTLHLFTQITLIEELSELDPPSITNCQINNTALTCNDFVRFSCDVTDVSGVDTVTFGIDDLDGQNVETASLDTGNTFVFDKQYTANTNGINESYNFTNSTAIDIVGNVNDTILNLPFFYSCFIPDTTPPVIIAALINDTIVDLRVTNQTVDFNVTDDVGLQNITFLVRNDSGVLDGFDIFLNASETFFNVLGEVDISDFAAGQYFIDRTAVDLANNTVHLNHQIFVLNFDTAIVLVAPANNTVISFFDTGSETFSVDFNYNSGFSAPCELFLNDTLEDSQTSNGTELNTFTVTGFDTNQSVEWLVSCDFVGATLNSTDNFFTVEITDVFQALEVGQCSTDTGAVLLLALFILLALFFIWLGISSGVGFIGFFGAIMLLILSWFVAACIVILALTLASLAVILIIFFVVSNLGFKTEVFN